MSYLALTFPDRIALGALRDVEWSTTVVQTFSGWTQRNINRSRAKHKWDLSFAVRVASDYRAIVDHFHEARGRAHTFPFKDYLDFQCAQDDGVLINVSGNTYQMHKVYGDTNPYSRKITRPVVESVIVYRKRGGSTEPIAPDSDSSDGDLSEGLVTVSGHSQGDTYFWKGEFNVPCMYDSDTLPGAIINRAPGATGEHIVQCESILIVEDWE